MAVAIALSLGPGCHSGGGSKEAFCAQVAQIPNLRTLFDTYDPTNPDAAKAQLDHEVAQLRTLQDASPSEVRDDVKIVADVAAKLVDAIGAIDPQAPLAGLQALDGIQADFDRVEAASTSVAAYASAQCGIELESPSTAATGQPTTSTSSP